MNNRKQVEEEIKRKLAHQFGKQFAQFIDDSPTLRRDLRRLKELGVRIKRWNGRSGAYCRSAPENRENPFIALGSLDSPIMKAIYLAHEAYHCLHGNTPNEPDTTKISRKRYISMGITEETRACMHQSLVAHELWKSCNHAIPAWQMNLLLVYHTSGYSSMRDHVLAQKESIGNGSYEAIYGRIWDQAERKQRKEKEIRRSKSRTSRSNSGARSGGTRSQRLKAA